eukprot:gene26631-35304_t
MLLLHDDDDDEGERYRESNIILHANEEAFEEYLKSLHDRTGPRYRQRVNEYKEFCLKGNCHPNDVINLEHYLIHLRDQRHGETNERIYCSSTLNSISSQISVWFQSALNTKPLQELPNLRNLLREWDSEETGEAADEEFDGAFEVHDVYRFLEDAPNSNSFIIYKLVLILSMYGFLRKTEIAKFDFEKLKVQSDCILGHVYRGRSNGPRKLCNFAITDDKCREVFQLYFSYFREDDRTGRLLRKLDPKTNKPYLDKYWGANAIAKFPKEIAKWLGKENPDAFSCRSLRIAGALLVENGADFASQSHLGKRDSSDCDNIPPFSNKKQVTMNMRSSSSMSMDHNLSFMETPAMMCLSTQQQLLHFYQDLKPADACPGCEVKVCFHTNYSVPLTASRT